MKNNCTLWESIPSKKLVNRRICLEIEPWGWGSIPFASTPFYVGNSEILKCLAVKQETLLSLF